MGRGKNAPKNLYIHKALSLIDAELELLNLKITHPEQFNSPVSTEFKSDLYGRCVVMHDSPSFLFITI